MFVVYQVHDARWAPSPRVLILEVCGTEDMARERQTHYHLEHNMDDVRVSRARYPLPS